MAIDSEKLKQAFCDVLRACGIEDEQEILESAKRTSTLWHDTILAGNTFEPASILSGGLKSQGQGSVTLDGLHIHMLCPHHLTLAVGVAQLSYLPTERIASLGALNELVGKATSRLVLQEDATQDIADALVEHLGAKGALVTIRAAHPCHNLTQSGGSDSVLETWAENGEEIEKLRPTLRW